MKMLIQCRTPAPCLCLLVWFLQQLCGSSVRTGTSHSSRVLPDNSPCLCVQRILGKDKSVLIWNFIKILFYRVRCLTHRWPKIFLVSIQQLRKANTWETGLNRSSTKKLMFFFLLFSFRDCKKETSRIRNFPKWPLILVWCNARGRTGAWILFS